MKLKMPISLALTLVILPVAASCFYFALDAIGSKKAIVAEMESVVAISQLAPEISNLVHELQKERGASAVFIASKGQQFTQALPEQQLLTDEKLNRYQLAVGEFLEKHTELDIEEQVRGGGNALGNLVEIRKGVSNQASSVKDMAAFYTTTIATLLTTIEKLSSLDAEINHQITAYTAFLQAKERKGLERAMGAAGFSRGEFLPHIYQRFVGLIAAQEAYINIFNLNSTSEQIRFYQETMASSATKGVDEMRHVAINSLQTGNTGSVKASVWFATITEQIDGLKIVEDSLASNIKDLALMKKKEAWRAYSFLLAGVFCLVVIPVCLSFWLSLSISRIISSITTSMNGIVSGDYHEQGVTTHFICEIKDMLKAVIVFIENSRAKQKSDLQLQQSSEEISNAHEKLIVGAHQNLHGIVDISTKTNGAFVTLASIIGDIEHVSSASNSIAAAIEEMSITVSQISERSQEASGNIEHTMTVTQTGIESTNNAITSMDQINDSVKDASETVNNLSAASKQINLMISDIDDIAGQTNLLALNATIEAARAGEAGKGFAVVANEVKDLARQTSSVTVEIKSRVDDLQREMEAVVQSMDQSSLVVSSGRETIDELGAEMNEINQNVTSVYDIIAEISTIMVEQQNASAEISEKAGAIARFSTQNSSGVTDVLDSMHYAVETINDRVEAFANLGTDQALLEIAKNDHIKFTKNVLDTILERAKWFENDVPESTMCRLGKWYNSDLPENIRTHPAFVRLEQPHAVVHETTKNILRSVASLNHEKALDELVTLQTVSAEVVGLLDEISQSLATTRG